MQGKARRFKVHKFTRHDSVEGHRFQPTPAVISVPEARLRNGPDPFTLPGVTVLREDGLDERAPPTSDLPQPRVEIYDLFSGNQVRRALQSSAIVVQLACCWAAPSTNNAPCWLLGGN